MFQLRVSVRCIMVRDGKLLLQLSKRGDFYRIPGGRVKPGETIIQALQREIREELGIDVVEPGEMLFIVESFYKRKSSIVHEIGFYFLCKTYGEPKPREPHIRVVWVEPSEVRSDNFRPAALAPYLRKILEEQVSGNSCPLYILNIET